MNILIAPNAFKNSLNAQHAAEAIAKGLKQSSLNCTCRLFPVGDGGDGTGQLIINKLGGEKTDVVVHDPLGRPITAALGLIDNGRTAIIEMADASGLRLLKTEELNPMLTNSFGTGQLISQALHLGVNKIIMGLGGSATVDGGAGMLAALGIRFLNAEGMPLVPIPAQLTNVAAIDVSGLDKRILHCEVAVLCDVDNTLLGQEGAAVVFGPQKGATAEGVNQLNTFLGKFAFLILKQTGIDVTTLKHGGSAGGAAAGLHAFVNARLVSGATEFLALTGFDEALQSADIVFTGEGSIDEQTLQGKAPAAVAALAKQNNLPVIGLAGKIPLQPVSGLYRYFDRLISINKEPFTMPEALQYTYKNLVAAAKETGDALAVNK